MKGVSFVITLLITMALGVFVLGLLTGFFTYQTSTPINIARAQRIFHTQCPQVDPAECDNFASAYPELFEACKVLFNTDQVGVCMVKCDCYICNFKEPLDNDDICN